ncbi:MAG TPA: adenylosuccinate synthase [Candidatus Binatia bacterium]|nr:adenylosuccinate synthase [Candidatus Binatia bacterium]
MCASFLSESVSLIKANTAVVVGAQWGDEGKGKIVDVLSDNFKVVARYAGGHNAGHTVIIGGKKFVLQLIPCGVLREGCRSVIGNGVVLDPIAFLKEVDALAQAGLNVTGRLFVSNRAQVILPYHRMIELASENAPGRVKIGTTSRGIGPAYEDKMKRGGLRVADLLNTSLLRTHIENACREKNTIAHALFNSEPLDADKMYEEYARAAERVAPFVADTALLLNEAIRAGEPVMFEGAQGTMLDIDHGTYPFVTSSSATSGGAVTGTGVAPNAIRSVIGVTKAYCTRVGEGPFPSEIKGEVADTLRARGNEYGAVTGRPRRCGWIDLPLLRYATMINGIDWMVVTKLDVLDTLPEIPVCVGYKIKGKKTTKIPPDTAGFEQIECVYESIPGWKKSTEGIRDFSRLPAKAQDYMKYLEEKTGARIGMVSTGPDRDQTIFIEDFAAEMRVREHAAKRG